MVKLEQWPKDRMPEGAVMDWESIADRRPKTQLFTGEAILEAKLIDPDGLNTPSERIPNGYRVLPVKVTSDMTSGLVQPGDEVDVLVVLRECGSVRSAMAKTILKKARVFAINEHFYRRDDAEGGVLQARTVSLQVTPKQVEALTLAQKLGDLSLSIRAPGDDDSDADTGAAGTSLADLMRTSDVVEDPGSAAERKTGTDLLEMMKNAAPPQMRVAAQPGSVPAKPAVRTQIIDQNGSRWYEYGPDGDMPREVVPDDGTAENDKLGPLENEFDFPAEFGEMGEEQPSDIDDAYADPDS
jgi:pilus assembly protein CpaB